MVELNINDNYAIALLVLMATYFSFNLAYDKEKKNVYTFIEEHVLQITPARKSLRYRREENIVLRKMTK